MAAAAAPTGLICLAVFALSFSALLPGFLLKCLFVLLWQCSLCNGHWPGHKTALAVWSKKAADD